MSERVEINPSSERYLCALGLAEGFHDEGFRVTPPVKTRTKTGGLFYSFRVGLPGVFGATVTVWSPTSLFVRISDVEHSGRLDSTHDAVGYVRSIRLEGVLGVDD